MVLKLVWVTEHLEVVGLLHIIKNIYTVYYILHFHQYINLEQFYFQWAGKGGKTLLYKCRSDIL